MTRILTLVGLLVLLPTLAAGDEPLLVTVGDVTTRTAVLWVRRDGGGEIGVEVTSASVAPLISRQLKVGASEDFTGKFKLDGLTPGTRYRYRLAGDGTSVTGEFVTAPTQDEPRRLTFLWSGDLGGGGRCRQVDRGYPIFASMARHPSDFFIFVGDTIYADVPCSGPGIVAGSDFVATTLSHFRAKHRYNRSDPKVQAFFRTTSVYAIWDDHEVKNDFSGPTEPLAPIGLAAFLDYWPIVPPAAEPTRLYRKFRWGRLLELFILDTRQYRSPNTARDGPAKTMLGEVQRRWLVDQVSASDARWKIIVSSVSLSVPTGRPNRRDSWSNANVYGTPDPNGTGFATERDTILRALAERGVRNLVVLAADLHHAELIRHRPTTGFSLHEFIAGPLSASPGRPRPLDAALNPDSLFARGGVNNFGEITLADRTLTVRIIDEAGDVLGAQTLTAE